MVGAAGPPVILDSGVAVATSGKVVRFRRNGTPTRDAERVVDSLIDALEHHRDVLLVIDAFDVEAEPTPLARDGAPSARTTVRVHVPPALGVDLLLMRDEARGLWHWALPEQSTVHTHAAATASRFDVSVAAPPRVQEVRAYMSHGAERVARFVIVRVADTLLAKGVHRLAEVFENRSRKGGLRMLTAADYTTARPEERDQLRAPDVERLGAGPSLLFLHGAMALSHATFGRMPRELLARFGSAYDGRTWAYDHHTLSQTPAQNAEALVTRLRQLDSPRLAVDVIAHDRGGLVARELAEVDTAGSPVEVRSVIFVATPNAGTPLCDPEHLQDLVDRYTNLFALIADNPISDIIDAVSILAASIAMRAAGGLVGLAAMDPHGPYQRELATRAPPSGVRYCAVASDFDPGAGTGTSQRLCDLATDHVFDEVPNDLVVPTDSAYRTADSVLVADADRFVFGREDGVDHAGFWSRAEMEICAQRWLEVKAPINGNGDGNRRASASSGPADAASYARERDAVRQTVRIAAVHASLEHAAHPLIVGHFSGVALQGAGVLLDARLGGRLSRRLRLGSLPEQIGDSAHVKNSSECDVGGSPPSALVVGLGPPGELTRTRLTTTFASALLRHAVEILDGKGSPATSERDPMRLKFSALAVGTSPAGGLTAEQSVAALTDAVVQVNDRLFRYRDARHGRAWDTVRISDVEIVALWEDRAELIAHAVRRVEELHQMDTGVHTLLAPEPSLIVRGGALGRRPESEEVAGEWPRLIIRERDRGREIAPGAAAMASRPGPITLEFTAVGGRTRIDRVEVTVDADAVDALVEMATKEPRPADTVTRTLYELLVPPALKQELARFDNLHLIVDEKTSGFPWEALAAAPGRELACSSRLLRQFRELEGRRPDVRSPVGDNVLVIGNPPAAPLPSLSGARQEAEHVAGYLAPHFRRVEALIWDGDNTVRDDFSGIEGTPARRILNALFSREWQIVHIASHGQFEPSDSSRSGAVIGHEAFLSANVAGQLPVVPEVVFLDCGHTGHVADAPTRPRRPHRLAASAARELMRIGVRVVVASGWAVDDDPAVDFACTFYDELLQGRALGEAVHNARRLVREKRRYSMTWCAYQCYGDPAYRLREAPVVDGPARRPTTREHAALPFVSTNELIRRVQTLQALAGAIGSPGAGEWTRADDDFADELHDYLTNLRPDWERPEVFAAFGAAFAELGRSREAVDCYRRAWFGGSNDDVPVKVLEQLGSFEIRLAQQIAAADRAAAEVLVSQAREHLELTLVFGITGARLALLGWFNKKAATLAEGDARRHHLDEACRRYEEAHAWRRAETADASPITDATARADPDYIHAWLQMTVIAQRPAAPEAEHLLDAMDASPEFGTAAGAEAHGYSSQVTRANGVLTRAILNGTLDRDELTGAFRNAFATPASRRERDATIDHLRDLAALTDDDTLRSLAAEFSAEHAT